MDTEKHWNDGGLVKFKLESARNTFNWVECLEAIIYILDKLVHEDFSIEEVKEIFFEHFGQRAVDKNTKRELLSELCHNLVQEFITKTFSSEIISKDTRQTKNKDIEEGILSIWNRLRIVTLPDERLSSFIESIPKSVKDTDISFGQFLEQNLELLCEICLLDFSEKEPNPQKIVLVQLNTLKLLSKVKIPPGVTVEELLGKIGILEKVIEDKEIELKKQRQLFLTLASNLRSMATSLSDGSQVPNSSPPPKRKQNDIRFPTEKRKK